MHYLSVCAIIKDEQEYIEEWINFHRAVGFDHFFLYDNESEIPLKQTLSKYVKAGIVDVIDFPGWAMQKPAYDHCLKNFGNKTKWLGFFDIDEFTVPKERELMSETLIFYEQFSGVGLNWRFFGANDLVKKPEGLVIENFTKTADKNWCLHSHIKSIVQPQFTIKCAGDPHWFDYSSGYAVSESYAKLIGSLSTRCNPCAQTGFSKFHTATDIPMSKWQLNHYYTKSEDEYVIRCNRRAAHLKQNEGGKRELGAFNNVNSICRTENKDIFKFIEKTKSLYL